MFNKHVLKIYKIDFNTEKDCIFLIFRNLFLKKLFY